MCPMDIPTVIGPKTPPVRSGAARTGAGITMCQERSFRALSERALAGMEVAAGAGPRG